MKTRLTNNDMARHIIQALYNLPHLPAPTHRLVLRTARRGSVVLGRQFDLALSILKIREKEKEALDDFRAYLSDFFNAWALAVTEEQEAAAAWENGAIERMNADLRAAP